MDKHTFDTYLQNNADKISAIRMAAHKVHADVNQHYDRTLPYGFHLDMVADYVKKYAYTIAESTDDILPIIFGAYFHDSIEDARLTYNNVLNTAAQMLGEEIASVMATEIAYALTNEKGRTRAERANDKYYQGIRSTPYAPLCKFADRLANVSYSASTDNKDNSSMRHVYAQESQHFIDMITEGADSSDIRLTVPKEMVDELQRILQSDNSAPA